MNIPAKAGTLKSNTESGKGRERRGMRGKLFSSIKTQRGTGWGGLEMPLERGGMDGGHRDWDGVGAAEPFPGNSSAHKIPSKIQFWLFQTSWTFCFPTRPPGTNPSRSTHWDHNII